MGIEQSTIGGLTTIETNRQVMERWYLTAHLKASVSSAFFAMAGLSEEKQSATHKEATSSRNGKDETFVKKITNILEERMFNPFLVEAEWTEGAKTSIQYCYRLSGF